jgi:hypothetical protein
MLTVAQLTHAIDLNNRDPDALAVLPDLAAVFGFHSPVYTTPIVEHCADLQRSMALSIDGVVGPRTRTKLKAQRYLEGSPLADIWPALSKTPWDFIRACPGGLELHLGESGYPTLVALRGSFPNAARSHRSIHAPRYDDTFVAVGRDGHPQVFRGATHAYQLSSSESPKGQVGSIRPGLYRITLVQNAPVPIFSVKLPSGSGDLPCWRDIDHDGVISAEEAELSEEATKGPQVKAGEGMYANQVLVHPGWDTAKPGTGRAFSSIACLTAPLVELQRLARGGHTYDLILLDAPMAEQGARGLVTA